MVTGGDDGAGYIDDLPRVDNEVFLDPSHRLEDFRSVKTGEITAATPSPYIRGNVASFSNHVWGACQNARLWIGSASQKCPPSNPPRARATRAVVMGQGDSCGVCACPCPSSP